MLLASLAAIASSATGWAATYTVNDGDTQTISGHPDETLEKNGLGTLIVTGSNNHRVIWLNQGTLIVDGGTLLPDSLALSPIYMGSGTDFIVQNGGEVTAGVVYIEDDSWIDVSRATITGTGSTLTSTSTIYVGGSSPGELTVANGGHVATGPDYFLYLYPDSRINIGDGSAAGSITTERIYASGVGQGIVSFNHNETSYIFAVPMDDAEGGQLAVEHIGSGTTILTGINTYTGGTTVSNGTLQGDSHSLQGDILNNASVVFNQETNGHYTGEMTGSGGLTKTGSGSLTLTGTNGYTGNTTVNAGILNVDGRLTASTTTVNSGGTLGGRGTVDGVILNGGTLAPGNSIGVLTVSSVDFSAGGTYAVEVDAAGNSDRLMVLGNALLTGGTVQVLAENGSYAPSTDYTILTAGSLTGHFDSVSSNLAFLDPSLRYAANSVYLRLTRNDIRYDSVAQTPNQRAVAQGIQQIQASGPDAGQQLLLDNLNTLSPAGARRAYDSLSGIQHAGGHALLLASSQQFLNHLSRRSHLLAAQPGVRSQAGTAAPVQLAFGGDLGALQLAMAGPSVVSLGEADGSGLWITPQAGVGRIDDTTNAAGFDYHHYSVFGGADRWLDARRLVGAALGYTRTDADPDDGDLRTDSLDLALYGRWLTDTQYLDASIGSSYHRSESSRRVTVGGFDRLASADYDAYGLSLSAEVGHTTYTSATDRITPFAGLAYAYLKRDGFSEDGAGSANLVVDGETEASLRSRLGVRVQTRYTTTAGREFDWDLEAAWAHEFQNRGASLTAGFEGATTIFTVDGPDLDRNRMQLGLGLHTALDDQRLLRLGYVGEIAGSDNRHALSASYRMTW